ncbi:MAG TPA: histidinol-phosphatase [Stackebrandtia sp.]|jgi:histidinol-phosphatase|uniref:histidinol-phosphatase n=1 Tax=Stackebrandtia sp. TaxID=2023065 RepID=UPI002D244695|nr:histidinol-phosphatase [Stackebrandtia sp.]HZE38106.1 histidinol-phosphatase [Stackebrandtia sp.]
MSSYADDLGLAQMLADSADSQAMDRFRAQDLRVETKPDMTPVTDADMAVEKAMRSTLSRARPRDGVYGEEFGDQPGTGSRRWVIDPIDGTKNFVRGVPVWATLIALFEGTEPVVGVVSAPALGRRWWAGKGTGAYAGRHRNRTRRLEVSGVRRLSNASISYSSLPSWFDHRRGPEMVDLLRGCWRSRGYGDFYSYVLVAEGAVDIACEPEVALWDLAPLSILVTEAGGTFTDLGGKPGPDGGSAVATNGLLHDQVLGIIGN